MAEAAPERFCMTPSGKATRALDEAQTLRNKNVALQAENLKLQRRIVTMEAQMVSARNKIIALRERIPAAQLTDHELKEVILQEETATH
jgi:uncharacterized protein YaaN involved in tellurite resistance